MDVTDAHRLALSPNSQALAAIYEDKTSGLKSVWISSPVGSALRPYLPAPFATKDLYNEPALAFSPDGRKILYSRTGAKDKTETWLLPYPPGGASPRQIFQMLPAFGGTPGFSWMDDSRHLVSARPGKEGDTSHLWISDTESDRLQPLTFGTTNDSHPSVSPDGQRMVYSESSVNLDIVSVSLENGSLRKLIATERSERMAAWSARQSKFVYVTDKNGPSEIWLHGQDDMDRAVVTPADFPKDSTKWLMNPTLSPEADKIIFARIATEGAGQLWVRSLAGGAPVRMTTSSGITEYGGSFSPDSKRFAFVQIAEGKAAVAVHRIGAQAKAVTLKEHTYANLPAWSPTGDWITFRDKNGWNLISPDGKNSRSLGKIETPDMEFSKDGKMLYGIKSVAFEPQHQLLFSLDIATLKMQTIADLGRENSPHSDLGPGIRFSLAPDGKSFIYSTSTYKSNLWLLEGFPKP